MKREEEKKKRIKGKRKKTFSWQRKDAKGTR